MNDLTAAFFGAAWLGILTSISPCPLATNIAAVSFLARRMQSRHMAVAGALAYAAGRAFVYLLIGLLVTWGLASAPSLSSTLQRAIFPFLGPLLILVGLVLLGWLKLPVDFGFKNEAAAEALSRGGLLGEFALGALFALTFCPVSAALFFGALLPMAMVMTPAWPLFATYGIATALPVGVLAVLLALGAGAARRLMQGIQSSQKKIRTLSGTVIILIGIWLTTRLFFPGPAF
jgi:cytochrome c biogenesis protein CcdA